jgi:hypothetical protein
LPPSNRCPFLQFIGLRKNPAEVAKAALNEILATKKTKNGKLGYCDLLSVFHSYHDLGHTFLKRQQLTYLLTIHEKRISCDDVVGVSIGETLVDILFENDTSTLMAIRASNNDNDNDFVKIGRNMGGRPKRLLPSKQQEANKLQIGLFEAATKYDKLMKKAQKRNIRVQKGLLQKIVTYHL